MNMEGHCLSQEEGGAVISQMECFSQIPHFVLPLC